MTATRTQILGTLVVLAATSLVWSIARLDTARDRAAAAERDLAVVHKDIMEMTRPAGGLPRVATGRLDPSELDRRIRYAATAAGLADKLSSTETGNVVTLGESDYKEMPMTFRFDAVTLQQLTVFLHQLATIDPGSRAKEIELTPPQPGAANAGGDDRWTADITIAYLIFAPKETK